MTQKTKNVIDIYQSAVQDTANIISRIIFYLKIKKQFLKLQNH